MTNPIASDLFANGQIIRHPVGPGAGYWVGSPGAYYDEAEEACYLTYRIRRPRGVVPDRGGEARIARSTDLVNWTDVLTVTKDRYQSASIERSCLHRGRDGRWRYFTSYVNPADGRWCTAVMSADTVAGLDPARSTVLFAGPSHGLEGMKDPWIIEADGSYHMFLSVALPTPQTGRGSHETLDIFNTGECKSATGLALSHDLDHWEWQGLVLTPETSGWDCYCRRLNSVVPLPPDAAGRYLAFYDGSASHLENYEEKCALAVSDDLRIWDVRSRQGPALTSPHGSQSLRYLDAKFMRGAWRLFYEFTRPDGAHDMRLVTVETAAIAALPGNA